MTRTADEYEKLRASLHCQVTEEDYRSIERKLESLKEMAAIENRAVSVYDINKKAFLLKHDNHLSLLGYDGESELSVDNYHRMIHPDDLPMLYDSEMEMYRFLSTVYREAKKDYKLVYDYRVRGREGRYVRFLHQLLLYELDRNFNAWLVLIVSDVLSPFPGNERPRRFLLNMKTNEVCLFREESGITRYIVTRREKEILDLVSQGFESREIADKLCISMNTVNNHRQHVLLKTATRNTTQAITYLKCIGVL